MPSPSERLLCPRSGSVEFAIVPEIRKFGFPAGPVILLYGRREFGAQHIWNRHQSEMKKKGFMQFEQVPDFVSTIVKPGAPLHFEPVGDAKKLAVVQSVSGTVILKLLLAHNLPPHYSVVTAYLGFNRHGPRVGSLT